MSKRIAIRPRTPEADWPAWRWRVKQRSGGQYLGVIGGRLVWGSREDSFPYTSPLVAAWDAADVGGRVMRSRS